MTAAACWEESQLLLPSEVTRVLEGGNDPSLSGLELLAAIPE